jgi:hypothetical protein
MKQILQSKKRFGFLLSTILFASFVIAPNTMAAASWQLVGSAGFSAGTAAYTSLAFNGNIHYIAYQDGANNNKATVMGFIPPTSNTNTNGATNTSSNDALTPDTGFGNA